MTIPSNTVKYKEINNISLFYERRSSSDIWGDLVREEESSFHLDLNFKHELDMCFASMWKELECRPPSGIISGGAWVDKPGMHREGRAFDLDGLTWGSSLPNDSGLRLNTFTHYTSHQDRLRYLAIQAVLLMHFGVVLGRHYNSAHEDHFHIDNSRSVGFRHNSRAIVGFIQVAMNVCFGKGTLHDSEWGPKTWGLMRGILGLDRAQGTRYPTDNQYMIFLKKISDHGKGLFPATATPTVTTTGSTSVPDTVNKRIDRLEGRIGILEKYLEES